MPSTPTRARRCGRDRASHARVHPHRRGRRLPLLRRHLVSPGGGSALPLRPPGQLGGHGGRAGRQGRRPSLLQHRAGRGRPRPAQAGTDPRRHGELRRPRRDRRGRTGVGLFRVRGQGSATQRERGELAATLRRRRTRVACRRRRPRRARPADGQPGRADRPGVPDRRHGGAVTRGLEASDPTVSLIVRMYKAANYQTLGGGPAEDVRAAVEGR